MSNFSALAPQESCWVVYAARCQVHWRFHTDGIGFAALIWYHTHTNFHTYAYMHTYTHGQTQTHNIRYIPYREEWSIYKYILITPVICSQHLAILYWMNNWLMSKIYFTLQVYNARAKYGSFCKLVTGLGAQDKFMTLWFLLLFKLLVVNSPFIIMGHFIRFYQGLF